MRLSLFFFLHLVALGILLLIHPHAKAEDVEWNVHDFGNYVVAAVPGNVIHGDKLRFFIRKSDCSKVGMIFSFSTTRDNKNINDLQNQDLPIRINKLDEFSSSARVITVHPLPAMTIVMMQFKGFHNIDDLISGLMKLYNHQKEFSITLIKNDHYNPEDHFDILDNKWKLEELPQNIKKAQRMCFGPGEIIQS
tara:strand:- start:3384 stop:3962 length:579 start_codon:yes stop_codon:yes gene_type:complete